MGLEEGEGRGARRIAHRRRGQHQLADLQARRRPGAWASEHPSLAQARAQRAPDLEVALVLDALGQHQRSGGLRVGVDGVHHLRHARAGAALDQAEVELDHVGAQQGHEGQRERLGAHVVDRDAPADLAHPVHRAQQLGRAVGQGPLGDLHHHPQLAGSVGGDGQQVLQGGAVQHLGLDVDEQGQRGQQARGDGPSKGRRPAGRVQLAQQAGGPRGGEEVVRALQRAAARPARQGLVGHHRAAVQVHDRLEEAAHTLRHHLADLTCQLWLLDHLRPPLSSSPRRPAGAPAPSAPPPVTLTGPRIMMGDNRANGVNPAGRDVALGRALWNQGDHVRPRSADGHGCEPTSRPSPCGPRRA